MSGGSRSSLAVAPEFSQFEKRYAAGEPQVA